jgi:thiol-disulfide isomerase/thioredoxin
MLRKIALIFIIFLVGCSVEEPTQFSKIVLKSKVYTIDNRTVSLKELLQKYRGKKVLIDVWASWCKDCVKGLPAVKNLQNSFPNVIFLFLSVDKSENAWKNGIQRFQIKGAHYQLPNGMKSGAFVDFIGLSWIPRYLVIDELGKITLFNATSASESAVGNALK